MTTRIQLRRDTAADWTSEDPILAEGEVGVETDTELFKIGDGSTAWSSLDYGNIKATSLADLTDVLGVSEIKMDTADNLTVGIANRLCLETDTGRVLYDNGASFVELGLSESQIDLGNLGSLDAGGNSLTNLLSAVISDTGDDVKIEKDGSGNLRFYNDTDNSTIATLSEGTAAIALDALDWADLAISKSDVDSTNWGDYEIQKDGSDTSGVINFKTS